MNGYDVFLFHVVQAMFVGLHVFMLERGKHARRTKEMLDFKVEQERQLGERMLQAEEAEKKRIAQDIHDEIGSIFVSLKYMVLSLCGKFQNPAFSEGLEPIRDLADAGIRKQYAIIDDLLLQPEAEKSLHALLLDKARIISEGTALQVEIRFETDESGLGEFRKLQIHRILSELIANTLKHAQAGFIKIHIRSEDGIRIRYADDGVGIRSRTQCKGMGLTNIHHRLEFMRGTMDIDSGTHGTIFDIRIPYDHE